MERDRHGWRDLSCSARPIWTTHKKKALRCHWSSLSFFCFYFIFSCLFVVYFINSKRFSLFFFSFCFHQRISIFFLCVCIPAECVRENTRARRVGGGGGFTKISYGICFSFFVHEKKKKRGGISFVVAVSFFLFTMRVCCCCAFVRAFVLSRQAQTKRLQLATLLQLVSLTAAMETD